MRTLNVWAALLRVTDAAAGQTNYQYDAFGLLKQASDDQYRKGAIWISVMSPGFSFGEYGGR
jgi:YD repeat-containing protein